MRRLGLGTRRADWWRNPLPPILGCRVPFAGSSRSFVASRGCQSASVHIVAICPRSWGPTNLVRVGARPHEVVREDPGGDLAGGPPPRRLRAPEKDGGEAAAHGACLAARTPLSRWSLGPGIGPALCPRLPPEMRGRNRSFIHRLSTKRSIYGR